MTDSARSGSDFDELGAAEWKTYAQRAYDEVRARILAGRLAAGSRIVVRVLSEDLGLSPTPIKSALAALEREGFLETVAYRGYSVPQPDRAAVAESFEVISAMDVLAVRRIMAGPDCASVVEVLREMVARQKLDLADAQRDRTRARASRAGPAASDDLDGEPRQRFELNFHKVLWDRSGNRQLGAVADHQRGLVLVASGGPPEPPDRRAEVLAEHIALVDAMAAGDVDAAIAVCERHMAASARNAMDQLAERSHPDDRPRRGPAAPSSAE